MDGSIAPKIAEPIRCQLGIGGIFVVRYTDARPMPSGLAISVAPKPLSLSFLISAPLIVGLRLV